MANSPNILQPLHNLYEEEHVKLQLVQREIDEYTILGEKVLKMFQKGLTPSSEATDVEELVEVGEGIQMRAVVDKNMHTVFVHIGCGILLDLSFSDALSFITEKKHQLLRHLNIRKNKCLRVKTDIERLKRSLAQFEELKKLG
eukprot:g249.t1